MFKGGVTSLIDFQSLFIQTKGNGMFNSVIKLVIVLHYYIFWRETVNKMTIYPSAAGNAACGTEVLQALSDTAVL